VRQGIDVLRDHAINGYTGSVGFMPAKGGRTDLSDQEVSNAVDYIVDESS
jgi:cytochrome c5